MIKSSLKSVGMTECLINYKSTMFGQPNQIDGKYCLSWQAGLSINFVLYVLVVVSWLAPNITFVLLCFWFHLQIAGSVLISGLLVKQKDNYFLCEHHSALPEDFINLTHVHFLEPPSIFPSQHPSPRLSGPPFDQCLRLVQVPLLWAALSGKHPAV